LIISDVVIRSARRYRDRIPAWTQATPADRRHVASSGLLEFGDIAARGVQLGDMASPAYIELRALRDLHGKILHRLHEQRYPATFAVGCKRRLRRWHDFSLFERLSDRMRPRSTSFGRRRQ